MPSRGLGALMGVVMALSLLAPIGLIVVSANAQSQQSAAQKECVRNGGWWERVTGVCEHGATASTKKANAYMTAKQACESKGGWFEPALGLCEFESAAKVAHQAAAYDRIQQACAKKGGWYDSAAGNCDTGAGK